MHEHFPGASNNFLETLQLIERLLCESPNSSKRNFHVGRNLNNTQKLGKNVKEMKRLYA